MSRNVYCNVNMTAFDIIAVSCGQQGPPTQQCTSVVSIIYQRIFFQYIISQCCCMCRIIQICHLSIFSYSHNWNAHWQAIAMLAFRPFRRLWQNRSSAYHKVLTRTTLKYWCTEKLFQRKSLAQECKYTILISIPSVLEPLDIGCTSLKYFTYTSSNMYKQTHKRLTTKN
jgi:hypothetical protein